MIKLFIVVLYIIRHLNLRNFKNFIMVHITIKLKQWDYYNVTNDYFIITGL